jgi:acyl-CoA thioesterase FadM
MTMFSAWTFTGGASFVYHTGWFGLLYFLTWSLSFLISFLMSAKRWRRTRITSPVEYIETRFNKPTHLFFSVYVTVGTIMASLARFVLEYSLGEQLLITVAITLLCIVISHPLGRMYNSRRTSALAFSLVVSGVLYFFLLFANHNPNLSPGTFTDFLMAGWAEFLLSAHFWLLLTALAFFALTYGFAALFGRDLNASHRMSREKSSLHEVFSVFVFSYKFGLTYPACFTFQAVIEQLPGYLVESSSLRSRCPVVYVSSLDSTEGYGKF